MAFLKQKILLLSILPCAVSFAIHAVDLCHAKRLDILKNKGFRPSVIYDIGAHIGQWTMEVKKVFPKAHYFLFEGNEHHKASLDKMGYPAFITLLGDCEKLVNFYITNGTGDSVFREQTTHYADGRCIEKIVPMTTLSTVVEQNELPLPDLIKMDVQGAEALIVKGSPDIIRNAQVVILEVGILEYNKNSPSLFEIIKLMDDLDFRVLDLLELHYLSTQELFEMDILFVKKDSPLITTGILS